MTDGCSHPRSAAAPGCCDRDGLRDSGGDHDEIEVRARSLAGDRVLELSESRGADNEQNVARGRRRHAEASVGPTGHLLIPCAAADDNRCSRDHAAPRRDRPDDGQALRVARPAASRVCAIPHETASSGADTWTNNSAAAASISHSYCEHPAPEFTVLVQ